MILLYCCTILKYSKTRQIRDFALRLSILRNYIIITFGQRIFSYKTSPGVALLAGSNDPPRGSLTYEVSINKPGKKEKCSKINQKIIKMC